MATMLRGVLLAENIVLKNGPKVSYIIYDVTSNSFSKIGKYYIYLHYDLIFLTLAKFWSYLLQTNLHPKNKNNLLCKYTVLNFLDLGISD